MDDDKLKDADNKAPSDQANKEQESDNDAKPDYITALMMGLAPDIVCNVRWHSQCHYASL